MSPILEVRAGSTAIERIRDKGLPASSIDVMLGASGGPKWFVLTGLDKALLGDYFKDRNKPLHLLGTSAGSWRFSCYGLKNPLDAHRRFEQGYLHTEYSAEPTVKEISGKSRLLLDEVFGSNGAREIIENPIMKFNLIAARSHGLGKSERKWPQITGMGLAAAANLMSRKALNSFFTRTLFHHPDADAPFHGMNDLTTDRVAFSESNLKDAVMASGSIPMVMAGVTNIAGAPAGIYRDGGVTDYHFDLNFPLGDGLTLYPHFYSHLTPGWFDKGLKWRRPESKNCKNLVLVSPSADFVSKLPYGKIPDRKDFQSLSYQDRVSYWKTVIKESDRLGEAFLELVASGKIKKIVTDIA